MAVPAVLGRIREIGNDPALLHDTFKAVTETRDKGLQALWSEQKRLKGERQRLSVEERNLIANASRDEVAGSLLADRLAEIQDRIQHAERRLTEIREEIVAMQGMLHHGLRAKRVNGARVRSTSPKDGTGPARPQPVVKTVSCVERLLLAPDIQEEILFLPRKTEGRCHVIERSMRATIAEPLFANQRHLWRGIRQESGQE